VEIKLGTYDVKPASEQVSRLAMLLWGVAGCGKTTLAATAPGKKLWLLFDDGGTDSIASLSQDAPDSSVLREQILVVDFSHEKNQIIDKFKFDDGLKLGPVLEAHPDIETVVVDSTTRMSQMALENAISKGLFGKSSIEAPGMGAYGARNALLLRMFVDIMNVTGRYNRNVIFISHEAEPKTNDDGHVLAITMALGGQLPNLTTQKLGEVWYMADNGKGERKIYLRPFRVYKPMKTRMFDIGPNKASDFVWKYDIDNPDPKYEIATWFKQWRDTGGKKIAVPV
jgi:hypothetical protein